MQEHHLLVHARKFLQTDMLHLKGSFGLLPPGKQLGTEQAARSVFTTKFLEPGQYTQ